MSSSLLIVGLAEILIRTTHQHRTRRMPQYIVAYAAQQRLAQFAQTTCSGNDVVGRALLCGFANELARLLEVRDELIVDLMVYKRKNKCEGSFFY